MINPIKYAACAHRGYHRIDYDAQVIDTEPPIMLCRDCGCQWSRDGYTNFKESEKV